MIIGEINLAIMSAQTEIFLTSRFLRLRASSFKDSLYFSAFVHQRFDAHLRSGDFLPDDFQPSAECLELIANLGDLNGEQWVMMARSLPKPTLNSGKAAKEESHVYAAPTHLSEESISRRMLSIGVLPINDLALLAAYIHLSTTRGKSFKTMEVTTILNQHNCDAANISSALNSMTQANRKVDAKLTKIGSDYEMTEAGATHVSRLLSLSYPAPEAQPSPTDTPSP